VSCVNGCMYGVAAGRCVGRRLGVLGGGFCHPPDCRRSILPMVLGRRFGCSSVCSSRRRIKSGPARRLPAASAAAPVHHLMPQSIVACDFAAPALTCD
jgi:hypothetical protein